MSSLVVDQNRPSYGHIFSGNQEEKEALINEGLDLFKELYPNGTRVSRYVDSKGNMNYKDFYEFSSAVNINLSKTLKR